MPMIGYGQYYMGTWSKKLSCQRDNQKYFIRWFDIAINAILYNNINKQWSWELLAKGWKVFAASMNI